jgi:ubiquinone/menaquinone biosynthesis C-methylase UbiE
MNVLVTTPPTIDLTTIKSRQQVAWGSGDYAMIGTTLQIVGEMLCEAVDLRSNQRVLDVAAGNGNATLAAARRFAYVVSTDYVGSLLERGRERAKADRLPVAFQEADAENLPFPDASFDVVLSTFGVMFTPNQEQAARELLRVCRPGQDRTRQLDAGQLHRPTIQNHRQIRSAGRWREVTGVMGEQGTFRNFVQSECKRQHEEQELCFPLQIAEALGRDIP